MRAHPLIEPVEIKDGLAPAFPPLTPTSSNGAAAHPLIEPVEIKDGLAPAFPPTGFDKLKWRYSPTFCV